jgi:nitroimidazol reductase NimA-like FMN-containing flavoprotein (pyridoxamine 5'-phosphate oxidase superfamily)
VTGLTPDVQRLFEGPNYGHLATLMPDGSPHSVALWVGVEDGRVVFFTQPSSRKARNLEGDPRVAISVLDRQNAALEVIDRLSVKYTGKPFPMRSGVVYEVEVEKTGYMELPFEEQPR